MPTFTLNFSRPGNQIVGQYYNFVRLGFEGYRRIMEYLRDVAMHLSSEHRRDGTLRGRQRRIRHPGAGVQDEGPGASTRRSTCPTSSAPAGGRSRPTRCRTNATDVAVLRIVVREGLGMDLADSLLEAIAKAVAHLEEFPPPHPAPAPGFSHT